MLAAEHPHGGLRPSGREGEVGALLDRLDLFAEAFKIEVMRRSRWVPQRWL